MARFGSRSAKRWTASDLDNTVGRMYASENKRKTLVLAPVYPLVGLCRGAGLPEPVPEYTFHPVRKWRFDYAWPDKKIAVEIEGGVWTNGRHTRGSGFIADMEKYNAAARFGWRILRYVPDQIADALPDLQEIFCSVEIREMA